jgi:putative multiple sugar transport system ATP-binding protein
VEEDRIIRSMVDRDLAHRFPERDVKIGEPVLMVKDWSVHHPLHPERQTIKNVDFRVRRGEVVGIAGLMGAGRTEFAMSLFGHSYGSRISGRVFLRGKEIRTRTVAEAIENGIAYATEDRKTYGLNLIEDIKRNISAASLKKLEKWGLVHDNEEYRIADEFRRTMNIKAPNVLVKTGKLSGGNQQKVVLSKWIYADPEVLILDEPTRGIDVGAKVEVHQLIDELAGQGMAIMLISSDLPEVLAMSDRILVMREGHQMAILDRGEATQERVLAHAMGQAPELEDRDARAALRAVDALIDAGSGSGD